MSSKCNSWFQYAKFSPDVRQTQRTVSPTYRTPQWLRSSPHNLWLTIYVWKVDCGVCLPPPGNRVLPSVLGCVCWYSIELNSNSYYTSDLIIFTLLRQTTVQKILEIIISTTYPHSGVPSLFCQQKSWTWSDTVEMSEWCWTPTVRFYRLHSQHCWTAGAARAKSSRDNYIVTCDRSYRYVLYTQQHEMFPTEGLEEVLVFLSFFHFCAEDNMKSVVFCFFLINQILCSCFGV